MQKPEIPNFEFDRCCGSGAYGDVWLAHDMNGVSRAVKVLYKTRLRNLGVLDKEIRGLQLYCKEVPRHPNLIEVLHAGETDDIVYYVMELADNAGDSKNEYIPDTLSLRLNRGDVLSPESVRDLGWSILDAVSALHQVGLIHRDIKPDNIVYVNGKPKLADIGLITSSVHDVTVAGTQGFIPPEGVCGCGADLYAIGKLLYCALTGNEVSAFPSLPDNFHGTSLAIKINQIILKACAIKPAKRFQCVSEFQLALTGEDFSFSKFRYFTMKNAIALVALMISIFSLLIVIAKFCPIPSNSYPPASIMHQGNILLPKLQMQLIYIEKGQFERSNVDKGKSKDNLSFIPNHYWIGQYEVTQKQYKSIMGVNPATFKGENFPIETITWPDAVEFCRRLTVSEQKKNRLPTGYEYRLPTNDEWVFAANARKFTQSFDYSGSNTPDYFAWYEENSNNTPHSIGTKNPNQLEIYDMSGNVWEFCQASPKQKLKKSNQDFYKENAAIRGGSWKSSKEDAKLSVKYYCASDIKMDDTGFRVVLGKKINK